MIQLYPHISISILIMNKPKMTPYKKLNKN